MAVSVKLTLKHQHTFSLVNFSDSYSIHHPATCTDTCSTSQCQHHLLPSSLFLSPF